MKVVCINKDDLPSYQQDFLTIGKTYYILSEKILNGISYYEINDDDGLARLLYKSRFTNARKDKLKRILK